MFSRPVYYKAGAIFVALCGMMPCVHADWKQSLEERERQLAQAHTERVVLHPLLKKGSEERIERPGVLISFDNAEATILLCHGFLCNKYDIACFRNLFPWGRFNFLTFDFRGHGEACEGQCSTLGCDEVLDVIAAGEFLKNDARTKDKPIFVWAFSMGSVAAIGAQANSQFFDGMILDCPYDTSENLIRYALDRVVKFSVFGYEFDLPGRAILEQHMFHPYVQSFLQAMLRITIKWDARHIRLMATYMNPVELAEQIRVPCFFIHCKNDEKVPVAAVKRVYDAVAAPKQLWLTNGRGHFDSFFYNPEKYAHRVSLFIESVLHKELEDFKNPRIVEDEDEKNIRI